MKVILLTHVPKLGERYDVKDVAPGFAINKLIPNGLAELATTGALKHLESQKEKIEKERAEALEVLLQNIEKIEGSTITVNAKANDQGHLFAAVQPHVVAEHLSEATGLTISESRVKIGEPIKKTGEHEVEIDLGEKTAKAKVLVRAI